MAEILIFTGSTNFGDSFDDRHSFTGSVNITGSTTVNGYLNVSQHHTVNGTINAITFIEVSTLNLKKNIKPQFNELNNVLKLRPVDFTWKDTNINDKGFIAEEVNEIYPEFVFKDSLQNVVGMNYSKLVSVLVKSVQELHEIIKKQDEELNFLNKKINGDV
jgi:hypothetical protein